MNDGVELAARRRLATYIKPERLTLWEQVVLLATSTPGVQKTMRTRFQACVALFLVSACQLALQGEPDRPRALGEHLSTIEAPPTVASFELKSGEIEMDAVDPESIEPLETRVARRYLTVYAAPRRSAPIRGRIPMGRAFSVHRYVEGEACSEPGWVDVGEGGFVCANASRVSDEREPTIDPEMVGRGLAPFYYARNKATSLAPRWASAAAYRRGDDPIDTLERGHDYAFRSRKFVDGDIVLIDSRGRLVLESDVRRFRPSSFSGRELAIDPLPEGTLLAWTVRWPDASVYAEQGATEPAGALPYHTQLEIDASAMNNDWVVLDDGQAIRRDDLRIWSPVPKRDAGIQDGELWIDVDLDQQLLTVMVDETPVFATLVSSGFKGPTPTGLFRIHNKQVYGTMSSGASSSDYYNVEAVPFVQYFSGGFAIHGAYWHDYFGRPISHGCVNLSPYDARRVFSMTSPTLSGGWNHAYEVEGREGTTLRIRRGQELVADRRGPIEPVFGT